jgi:hypothetical protein
MAFVGLSDSYEKYYQATRRCWRFGQESPVDVYVVTSDLEGAVVRNIERKEAQDTEMRQQMTGALREHGMLTSSLGPDEYARETEEGDGWTMHLGDCVDVVAEMPSDSIHCALFSPPFSSLYTYSDSARDMGNCQDEQVFMDHFGMLARQLMRVLMPGRMAVIHCMNLPTSKFRHGHIGMRDFRGEIIRLFQEKGFIYHSEVTIWKDPVTAMQRTKALGLLYKQLRKDSAMSRQGIPDYLVIMRKPGKNPEPVGHTPADFPLDDWQKIASPVWMTVNQSRTLQRTSARAERDERHIAPLQLDVIENACRLWTNPGDLVLSPFGGIGSEGYGAITMGRRFVGVELKRSYYEQAVKNLRRLTSVKQLSLFGEEG